MVSFFPQFKSYKMCLCVHVTSFKSNFFFVKSLKGTKYLVDSKNLVCHFASVFYINMKLSHAWNSSVELVQKWWEVTLSRKYCLMGNTVSIKYSGSFFQKVMIRIGLVPLKTEDNFCTTYHFFYCNFYLYFWLVKTLYMITFK